MKNTSSKVEIVPNQEGAKIRVSKNNAEYAHVLLKQDKTSIQGGWVRKKTYHALLHGKLEDLKDLGLNKMKYMDGQIVVKEQLFPFNTENPEADYKYAGDTGIVCCKDGEPIYRKASFDATGLETDVFVGHTNGDAIREANNNESFSSMDTLKNSEEEEVDENQVDLEDAIAEAEEEKSMISKDELDDNLSEDEDEVLEEVEVEEPVSVEEDEVSFDL